MRIKLRSLLVAISMVAMASIEVLAISTGPRGIIIEAQQPDGTKIKMKVVGDEYNLAKYTLDGYTITQDEATKEYRYADETKSGKVYASDKVVGKDKPPAFLKKGLVVPEKELSKMQKEYISQRRKNFNAHAASVTSIQQASTEDVPTLQSPLDGPAFAPPAIPTVGTQNGFCMLISFADDPVTPDFAPADIYTMFNGPTPIWGNAGSIKQYFFEQSNGKMTLNTTVSSVNVRLTQSRAYYDNGGGLGAVEAVKEALSILLTEDPAYFAAINLTTMNSGGKQVVKAFSVFYPGNPSGNDLWPHSWVLNSGADPEYVEIKAGVYVSNYQMSSLLFSTALPVIGVACHEIGHMLCDFSDYYDYGNRAGDYVKSYGLGTHCLMSDSENTQYPAQVNPYLRMKAGWIIVPPLPDRAQLLTLTPTNFYRYAKSPTEYFLFSNVQKAYSLWTQYLPAEGIAIWHIDEKMPGNELQQMTTAQHYECSLEQADGMFHLEQSRYSGLGNSGDANDLYYLGNSSTNYLDKFSKDTIPSSRWWDGTLADPFLERFSELGWTMTTMLDFPPPEIATTSPLPEGRVGSPYRVQMRTKDTYTNNVWALVEGSILPPGLTLSPSGFLSGVPTLAGTNTFDIFVTGRSTVTATNTFVLVILSAYAAPYFEGFNGAMEDFQTGWHQESVSNALLWRVRAGSPSGRPSRAFEGEQNAYLGVFTDTGSASYPYHITRLISPMIQFKPSAREVRISFAYYLEDRITVLKDSFSIYYKTAWSNDWIGPLATFNSTAAMWLQYSVTLPESAAGKGVYFAIEGSALGGHGISLDAVQIDDPVPALQIITPTPLPIALCETNYSLTTPLVTLASVGGFTNTAGFTVYSYAVVNGTALPSGFTLTPAGVIIGQRNTSIGLTAFDVEVTDAISGAKATNTLAFAVEYPRAPVLQENFLTNNGDLPSGWTIEYVANRVDWKIGTAGGKDGKSPPSAAHSDYQYAFFFGTPSVGTYMVSKLVSPVFDLTQMPNNSRLVFWHFMQKWSGQDQLRVYYRNVTGAPWTKLETYTNNVTSWTQRSIQLPSPSRTYQIAFEGYAKSGYGVCVDTVSITDDAGAPVILTRDELPSGFDNFSYQTRLEAVGGITPYRWAVVSNALPRGLTLDPVTGIISGIPVGATQTFFRVAVTGYDNKASTNLFSLKILPPGLIPYFETFSETTLPTGWEQQTTYGSVVWRTYRGTYCDYPNTTTLIRAPVNPVSEPLNLCLWGRQGSSQSANLITEPFDLGGGSNTTVSFWLCMKAYLGNQDELNIYYRTHESGIWKLLKAYDASYFASTNAIIFSKWTQQTIELPEPSATYRLKFEGWTRGGWGICVDDVDVRGERTAPPLVITTPSPLPAGTNLVVYPDVTLQATGGTALPYTWRIVTSDILPPGLTLSTNGVISGTPTQYGLYSFGVTVQDANNVTTTQQYTLRIWSSGLSPYEQWKSLYFPPPAIYMGDDVDQSGDGIPNLLKYGMGLNPTNQNLGIYILGGLTNLVGESNVADGRYLYLGYRRSLEATDLDFFVKGTTDLTVAPAAWSTNNIPQLLPWTVGEVDVWSWVYNVHTTPVTNAPQRFLRLSVELQP